MKRFGWLVDQLCRSYSWNSTGKGDAVRSNSEPKLSTSHTHHAVLNKAVRKIFTDYSTNYAMFRLMIWKQKHAKGGQSMCKQTPINGFTINTTHTHTCHAFTNRPQQSLLHQIVSNGWMAWVGWRGQIGQLSNPKHPLFGLRRMIASNVPLS